MTTLLLILAAWVAVSIPVSVVTGRFLARRDAELVAAMERLPAGSQL